MAKDKDKKRSRNGGSSNAALMNILSGLAGGAVGAIGAGLLVKNDVLSPSSVGWAAAAAGGATAIFTKGKLRYAGVGMGAVGAGQIALAQFEKRQPQQQQQQQGQQQGRRNADVDQAFRAARENMERNAANDAPPEYYVVEQN